MLKSSPIEIPELPGIKSSSESKTITEESAIDCSFYDLLQSYYDDIPVNVASKNTDSTLQNTPKAFDEAPHFDLVANDLDVDNILNCSQKLLKSVSSTLHRVQLNASIVSSDNITTKYNNSIESLDVSPAEQERNDEMAFVASKLAKISELYECIEAKSDQHGNSGCIADVSQLPRAILKRWFREIIFAVKHLHANDIVCYDLKPDNLLLGKNGEILLTYFYRREFNPYCDVDAVTQTCYPVVNIAPERPNLSFRSDVWSIGIIFYELITGYTFQSCHPDGILSYFELQYPENYEPDANTKDLLERVRHK